LEIDLKERAKYRLFDYFVRKKMQIMRGRGGIREI
jgi:hypothetical protein